MPGYYQAILTNLHRIDPVYLAAPRFSVDPDAPSIGLPLFCPGTGFANVAMGQRVGGRIRDSAVAGYWTNGIGDCVAVAAMQQDENNEWIRYFFTHLQGGAWVDPDAEMFNQSITNTAQAFIALTSTNTGLGLMTSILNDINKTLPQGSVPFTPYENGNALIYDGSNSRFNPATFALNLNNSRVGAYQREN